MISDVIPAMVTGVAKYRAYTVGHDGHFIGFEPLVCADDADAIENAKRLVVGMPLSFGAATAAERFRLGRPITTCRQSTHS
jgi:hypothetical protein